MASERPMHPPEPLRVRLARAREKQDLKQADLAALVRELGGGNIQQGRISSWERGAKISDAQVRLLARALGVDPGWLSHGLATAAPAPKWWTGTATEVEPTDDGEEGSEGLAVAGKPSKGPTPKTRQPAKRGRRIS